MKLVINKCYGGFELSSMAYEKLIEYGVPVRKYIQEKRNPKTRRYEEVPENEGKIIFDRELTPKGEDRLNDSYYEYKGKSNLAERYWETWTSDYANRNDPLIVRVVEELGKKANGWAADLQIVEIPDDIDYEIDDYDGVESVHEKYRSW
jgi:hypothetical protein